MGEVMIKLVCPECLSSEIHYIDKESIDENFKCKTCGKEFTFVNAGWETEF